MTLTLTILLVAWMLLATTREIRQLCKVTR
jgi:hypothetical protein